MPMRVSNMKFVAERVQGKLRALPASVFLLGSVFALSVGTAHAMQTDAATKAEMDKRASARTLLSSALSRIATNGNNAAALLDAGRASMALNDYRSALGFLLRAEQNAPRDGAIKAALGTAMVHQENPRRALDYFGEAQLLRVPERVFMADRALAYDLSGQQEAAQRDYAAVITQQADDEVTRRYALSLGISGQPDRGIELLTPQLAQQDRSAWRTRAMILAMNGRQGEAKSIVDATMPKELATNIWPYLEQMDRLTPTQLAEAAHFGRFPSGALGPKRSPVQMAAATPVQGASAAATGRGGRNASRAATAAAARAANAPVAVAQAAPAPAATAAVAPAAAASASAANSALPPGPRFNPPPTPSTQSAAASALPPGPRFNPPPSPSTQSAAASAMPPGPRFNPPPAAVAQNSAPDGDTRQRGPATMARDMTAAAATDAATRTRVQNVVAAQTAPLSAPAPAPAAVATPRGVAGPVDPERSAAATTTAPAAAAIAPAAASAIAARPQEEAKPLAAMASLGDIIGSLQIPANELVRSDEAVGADTLVQLRDERRRAEQLASAERAAKARADAAAKAKADAEAKVKAEADAKAREEAARKRANPARTWVQIGSGSNPAALEFTWNRFAKKHPKMMAGKSAATADWGRTRRLLVGPFPNRTAAQGFLTEFKAAEGDGFLFSSAVGEAVDPIS